MSLTRVGSFILALVVAIVGVYALFRAIDQRSAPPIVIEDAAALFPIVVEVRGAVESPGVYELPFGARVQDAVTEAGGLTVTADFSTINLARRLRDGEVVAVLEAPEATGPPESQPVSTAVSLTDEPARPMNINQASAAELTALPGVGEVTAQRIVEFREQQGPYRSIDDLVHVQGISSKTVEDLRDLVTVAP